MKIVSLDWNTDIVKQEGYKFVNLIATIYNHTDFFIELYSQNIEWGKYKEIPSFIQPKSKVDLLVEGRNHFSNGIQGRLIWRIRDLHQKNGMPKIVFEFDQPYASKNYFNAYSNNELYEMTYTITHGHSRSYTTLMDIDIHYVENTAEEEIETIKT